MKIKKFTISLLKPYLVAFLGGISTGSGVKTWYRTLTKPFFNPPNWIFGPVWTFLYTLMGISDYLVNNSECEEQRLKEYRLYYNFQLILNAA